MRILLLHNYYQHPGGEDIVVRQERQLLEAMGHETQLLAADNASVKGMYSEVKTALTTIYSPTSRTQVEKEIVEFRPNLVHVHNFFPLLSPSIYYACRDSCVPVVQTLHNYRLVCPNAILYRRGEPCERCLGKAIPWPGVVHACYRESFLGSLAVTSMLATHRLLRTWERAVSAYIALTEFARQKLVAGGLRPDRVFVKPNFVFPDPNCVRTTSGFALFVGRLSPEKGLSTLISAWKSMGQRRLKIVGDGPTIEVLRQAGSVQSNIDFLGYRESHEVLKLMEQAAFLVLPSEWYEAFPRVIVEAFAQGLPVLGSRLGSVQELVDHGRTGLLFEPGNPLELASAAEWLFRHPVELEVMSKAARLEFEQKYTAERNYEQLMAIYRHVLSQRELQSRPMEGVAAHSLSS